MGRWVSRNHKGKTCAQLTARLKHYGLPSSGRLGVLLARLVAHEATLPLPPFIAITDTLPFDFLALPNEIRNMIYKEILTFKKRYLPDPSILCANKQIYNEARGLFYSLNTIKIKIDSADALWLGDAWRRHFSIAIHQSQHYSEISRDNGYPPPTDWLHLPTYLRRCEKIKLVLSLNESDWQPFRSGRPTTMLIHLNSLVCNQLIKHQHLHTIYFELELTGKYKTHLMTTRHGRDFEQQCLHSLCRLRGMQTVHLKGFTSIDPFDIFLAKRKMLLPSSDRCNSFLTLPKMMQTAPQWWQLKNLSK